MSKRAKRSRGLPKALEAELAEQEGRDEEEAVTPKQFVDDFFPPTAQGLANATAEPQVNLPSVDWLKENYKTKSAAIRYLTFLGYPPKIVSKHLGIKYQHARNVAKSELKRGPNEDWRPPSERQPKSWEANLNDRDATARIPKKV
jgi:hypothetical protein